MLSLDCLHTFLGCFMEAKVLLNFVRQPTGHCPRLMVRVLSRGAWPRKRKFQVLEDNDPTGFKARAGVQAKAAVGIKALEIPKRSPDLNVCDYALWVAVNRKMRRQERNHAGEEGDSGRAACCPQLDPGCHQQVGDMRRRCRLLFDWQRGMFEEGGRPTQP